MNSCLNRGRFAAALLATLGVAYPFVVYATMGQVPAGALVIMAVALIVGRMVLAKGHPAGQALLPTLAVVAAGIATLGLIDAAAASKAYPVLMSLGFAAAFGLSLRRPPSLVERLASLTEPNPNPQARAYMRSVTAVWCSFLIANAVLSLVTALWGSDAVWTLYNGLIAYLLMGVLFAGEWLVRRWVRAGGQV